MNYPYETLEYAGRLEFKDAFGVEAYFHWYQRVRVLIPELLTVFQKTWGDGDRLAGLVVSPAELIHAVETPKEDSLVFELKEPGLAHDEVALHGIRHIHQGFTRDREWWEFKPFTPTERVRIALSYPVAKEPDSMSVTMTSGSASPHVQRRGIRELLFTIKAPIVGSTYRAEWSW